MVAPECLSYGRQRAAAGDETMEMMNVAKRSAIAIALGLLLVGSLVSTASAHAAYKDSNPADGATVSSPPSEVWAEFTEPPESSEASRLEVYDPCGARVDTGGTTASGYRMTTAMSADKQGKYTVVFQVVSALDGHPTKGQFTFTSTGGAPCPGSGEKPEPTENEGSGSGNGGSSGENSSSGTDEPFTVAGGGGDKPFDPVDALKHHDTKKKKKGKHTRHQDGKKKRDKKEQQQDVAQPSQTPPTTPAAETREIPMDWLLISFGMAALIGAAGGQIYVNLLGPKPRR